MSFTQQYPPLNSFSFIVCSFYSFVIPFLPQVLRDSSPSPQRLMLIQTYWCYHLLIFSLLYVPNMIPSQHYIPSPANPANEGIYHEEHVSKLSHRCLPGISGVINSSLQDVTEDQDWCQGNHVLLQALPFYKLTRWCHFSAQFS